MSGSGNGHHQGGYDPAFFRQLEFVEDRHFWFRARRRAVGAVLRQISSTLPAGFHALELGCGNGGMLRLMQQCCVGGTVFGMDLFAEAVANAHRRVDVPLLRGDIRQPPFAQSLNLICMFDVLEHLDNDLTSLQKVHSMLVPGGVLMLTVPAHMMLWSYFDEAANHVRRYAGPDLRQQLRAAGFTIEYQTQFMASIYPLMWIGRRLNYHIQIGRKHRTRQSNPRELTENDFRIVPGLNRLIDWSLSGEENLIRSRRRITRGTSILAVARRS